MERLYLRDGGYVGERMFHGKSPLAKYIGILLSVVKVYGQPIRVQLLQYSFI